MLCFKTYYSINWPINATVINFKCKKIVKSEINITILLLKVNCAIFNFFIFRTLIFTKDYHLL